MLPILARARRSRYPILILVEPSRGCSVRGTWILRIPSSNLDAEGFTRDDVGVAPVAPPG